MADFLWSWILKDCIKVQEKKKKIGVLCFPPRQNVKLGTVQRRLRNVQKSVHAMHMQSCYIANLKLLVFCRSRSDFKSWDSSATEKTHLQFCKHYLQVHNKASNITCKAELGKFPMTIDNRWKDAKFSTY